jgi:hypothetical protein
MDDQEALPLDAVLSLPFPQTAALPERSIDGNGGSSADGAATAPSSSRASRGVPLVEEEAAASSSRGYSISVILRDQVVSIPVGDVATSVRTVRWLAAAAVQRYHDRSRHFAGGRSVDAHLPGLVRVLATGEVLPPVMTLCALVNLLRSISGGALTPSPTGEAPEWTSVAVEVEFADGDAEVDGKGRKLDPLTPVRELVTGTISGQPDPRSPWQIAAYSVSTSSHKAAVSMAQAAKERVSRAEAEKEHAAHSQYEKLVGDRVLRLAGATGAHTTSALQGAELLAAVDAEWAFVRVDSLTLNADDALKLKAVIACYWADLSLIFDRYASTSSGDTGVGSKASGAAEVAGLQCSEWLHLAGVMDLTSVLSLEALAKVFAAANDHRVGGASVGDDNNALLLNHFEFLEALILSAHSMYGGIRDIVTGHLGCASAFTLFLFRHVAPLANWLRLGAFQEALHDSTLHLWMQPRLGALRAVFAFYSAADVREVKTSVSSLILHQHGEADASTPRSARDGILAVPFVRYRTTATGGGAAAGEAAAPAERHTLSLREFAVLLEHAGLAPRGISGAVAELAAAIDKGSISMPPAEDDSDVAVDEKHRKLTAVDIWRAFAAAQLPFDAAGQFVAAGFPLKFTVAEPGRSSFVQPLGPDPRPSLESGPLSGRKYIDELTFHEFLDALGRIALARWGDAAQLYSLNYEPDSTPADRAAALKASVSTLEKRRLALVAALDTQRAATAVRPKGVPVEAGDTSVQDRATAAAAQHFRGLVSMLSVGQVMLSGGTKRLLVGLGSTEEEENQAKSQGALALAPARKRRALPPQKPVVVDRNTKEGVIVETDILSIRPSEGARHFTRNMQHVVDVPDDEATVSAAVRQAAAGEVVACLLHWAVDACASVSLHMGQPTTRKDGNDAASLTAQVMARCQQVSKALAEDIKTHVVPHQHGANVARSIAKRAAWHHGDEERSAAALFAAPSPRALAHKAGAGLSTSPVAPAASPAPHTPRKPGATGSGPLMYSPPLVLAPVAEVLPGTRIAATISASMAVAAEPADAVIKRHGAVRSPFKFNLVLPRVIRTGESPSVPAGRG